MSLIERLIRRAIEWDCRRAYERRRKEYGMLVDKKASESSTIWGAAIKAVGLIVATVGVAMSGEAGWQDVWVQVAAGSGAILALVGMLIHDIGQRKATGRAIEAAKTVGLPVTAQPSDPAPPPPRTH